ncbi:pentatricopeptide repeat-containing protein [Quercus suber]|uniref:Pentatricopeptide repeat-containing protein n=1 Tax=Quercus suber TaxID=58331 RepID=A0AAW0LY77_QUESU
MHRSSVPSDSFSILFTLKSCAHLQNLTVIQHLHAHIVKIGFSSHVYVATSLLYAYVLMSFEHACVLFDEMPERNTVTWNTMISGYSRSGDVESARAVFEEMPVRDVASWSAMLAAYVNSGNYVQAVAVFRDMMAHEGLRPDQVTLGSVLTGCAHTGSLGLLAGKSVHGFIAKNGWELNVELGTVLVDMYAKCGFMKTACRIFGLMQERNVVSWTALICGSAQHGYSKEVLSLFEMMQKAGVRPNELTFTGILTACVHTGLVDEGRKYFKMIEECGSISNGMAERVIDKVLGMITPENNGGFIPLLLIVCFGEKWDEAERLRKLMLKENVKKARVQVLSEADEKWNKDEVYEKEV